MSVWVFLAKVHEPEPRGCRSCACRVVFRRRAARVRRRHAKGQSRSRFPTPWKERTRHPVEYRSHRANLPRKPRTCAMSAPLAWKSISARTPGARTSMIPCIHTERRGLLRSRAGHSSDNTRGLPLWHCRSQSYAVRPARQRSHRRVQAWSSVSSVVVERDFGT